MNTTGPLETAMNFPVPISVRNPGAIDCFSAGEGSKASRLPEHTVRLPSSMS